MKTDHSFKGPYKQRKGQSGYFIILLSLIVMLSACSSSSNKASESGTYNSSNRGETTAARNDKSISTDNRAPSERESMPMKENGKRSYPNKVEKDVQAGQLTAGEWDDLSAWERFGNLVNGLEADTSKRIWQFWNFQRLEVIVSANGKAVSDADVQLKSGKQTVWRARTNTEGRAYVYAGLFDKDTANQSSFTVYVESDQAAKQTQEVKVPEQGSIKIDLGKAAAISDAVDIMFVVDTTGSMGDELNYLGAELKDVVKRVSDEHGNQLDMQISANFYRDKHDEYIVKPYPFTKDINKVIDQFTKQTAEGGGDYPEAVDQALRDAIHEHQWSKEARARLLFLVLDAPPHDDPQVIDEIKQLTEDAAAAGIRIIPVASSGVSIDTEYLMRFFAVATGGTYIFLTDDSGIGEEHLEPAVGEYEVKLLNDLLVEVINRYLKE
ncbi:hypothetical protein FHS15_001253 [Paenibacillus castaneae]|uniref:vWA domain-containing protein n=1 Tax=Paenibacillus castaneae TaxID=474957 RepID=UPI00141B8775|nr:vWA domain-containing protein [Paenibacillus castaneae]NIK76146.1 hypothetical protein [Paenibacillus castaneae]